MLTTEAAHRTFVLDDHPELFRKVFTLGQFAEAVERGTRRLTGPTAGPSASPAATPTPHSTSPDPYRRGPEAASGARRASRSCCAPCCLPDRLTRKSRRARPASPPPSFSILAAGFLVGIVVGLTGMGGGALMTPALIFLGRRVTRRPSSPPT